MTLRDTDQATDNDDMIGFLDSEGKWITMSELAEEFDESTDEIKEAIDELAEIDIVRVKRNDDGEPVTAQLSPFAVDLYELPEDAPIDEVAGVYAKHGVEPPMEISEQYVEAMREGMADD